MTQKPMQNYPTEDSIYWERNETREMRVEMSFENNLPEVPEGGRILDMGCSIGWTTEELTRLYPGREVIGMDINFGVVQRASNERKGKYLCGDGYLMPFKENTFDVVFAMNNIALAIPGLVREGLLKKVLSELKFVTKPSGTIAITGAGRCLFKSEMEVEDMERGILKAFGPYFEYRKRLDSKK